MAIEREHKYLVRSTQYRSMATCKYEIIQGYIDRTPSHTVRIRRKGHNCYLTIKGITLGDRRVEYEYEIPESDFNGLLNLANGIVIQKTRYIVPYEGYDWEVDEFHNTASPLTIAEIELPEECDDYPRPPFVGQEVTGDPKYYNSNLE